MFLCYIYYVPFPLEDSSCGWSLCISVVHGRELLQAAEHRTGLSCTWCSALLLCSVHQLVSEPLVEKSKVWSGMSHWGAAPLVHG